MAQPRLNKRPIDWIKHNNIYFVPVIRQRLNFAVVVRRAAKDLSLSADDAIAVEMPPSIVRILKERISDLPIASVITAISSDSDLEEVFPVVPNDAIVEATRIALENELTLADIDQEMRASFFWNRHCFRDNDWPDDEIALRFGAAVYYALIEHKVRTLPARIEPVDSWRETYMAERLRQLYLRHQRVLCICEATHVHALITRLSRPASSETAEQGGTAPDYECLPPSTSLLLQYLDDFPAVVELYDKARKEQPGDFGKMEGVAEVVLHSRAEEFGEQPSIREMAAFTTLLRNLAQARGKLSPDLEVVSKCVQACFGSTVQETARRKLLKYGDQIRTKAVGPLVSSQEEYENAFSQERRFVARSCNPLRREYKFLLLPIPKGFPTKETSESGSWVWPPYSGLLRETMKSVLQYAVQGPNRQVHREIKAVPFDGTLGRGVDVRATLRSALQIPPRPFIKHIRNGIAEMRVDELEPIVLILDTKVIGAFRGTAFGLSRVYLEDWSYEADGQMVLGNDESGETVWTNRIGGFVSFMTNSWMGAKQAQKAFGRDIRWRVPRIDEIEESNEGLFPGRCSRYSASGFPWWVTLVLGAAEYAKANVIVVIPDDCELPAIAKRAMQAKKKDVCRIPLSRISEETQHRLRRKIAVETRLEFESEDDVWSGLVKHFESRVRGTWQ